MDYQEALDYIYSFANFETRPADQQTRADYTLDRFQALLAQLGNPQDQFPTVHIAGTKGKGSTAAMLASILTAAGYRAGLYTSPHLHTYRERIRSDGHLIGQAAIIDWIERHRDLLGTFEGLTTFEVTTAMGFDTFAREEMDVAVIEVGLGGRLDTTNVITPILSVITSISLDHTAILGDTIAEIALDKAGIIKSSVPVVTAPQLPAAMHVIQRVAGDLKSPLTVVDRDWTYVLISMDLDGQITEVRSPTRDTLRVWTPLIGMHEAVNTAVAVAAADELRRQSWSIDPTVIRAGLRAVSWPGRTEVLSQRPWIMVDGAHNGASARCLLDTLERLLGRRCIVLVFGASVDKRIDDMFDVLLPATCQLIVTQAVHPRAADPVRLRKLAARHGHRAHIVPTVTEALMTAVENAVEDDLILVTGSLFVVAEARMAWFEHTGRLLPPRDPPR